MSSAFGLLNYWVVIFLMMSGFYVVISQGNLVKKVIGLSLFQTSVFIFYITLAHVDGGQAPIVDPETTLYSNPLPHVLILTAIVVAVSTSAVALSLIIRIREAYGTIEEEEIEATDRLADEDESHEQGAKQ